MFSEVERQIRRDRINQIKPWLKSTGARTLEGKRISSKNALKHGLYSADPNIRAIAKANQLQAERDRIRSILCTYGLIKQ